MVLFQNNYLLGQGHVYVNWLHNVLIILGRQRHAHNKTQEVHNTTISEKVNRVLHDHVSRLTNDFYDKQFSILDSAQLFSFEID